MVTKCLECKHKCGLPFNLAFDYSIFIEDKIGKFEYGDKTLSGICIKELAQQSCFANSPMKTDCSFKDESGYNSSSSINSNSSSNSSSSSSINSNYSSNSNFNTKVLTRSCNKCNSVKPLTDFDESKKYL